MSHTPRLLVVDDEPIHRIVARIALESAGWRVDDVEDGAAALRAIAATRYAVVLLDICLPGADGFEIARTIRADRAIDHGVPILAYTSRTGAAIVAQAAAAGMDGHIAKPISAPELIERLARWWPEEASPTRVRLAATFGAREIAALNESFRVQLDEALDGIDRHDVAAVAHRIAGIAGTLGFMDVHETWLALSEEQVGAREAAASAARRTLRTLARD